VDTTHPGLSVPLSPEINKHPLEKTANASFAKIIAYQLIIIIKVQDNQKIIPVPTHSGIVQDNN